MALFDMDLDRLRTYRSASEEPADFDSFWARTLEETHAHALDARFEPVDAGLSKMDVFDVTFAGFGGHPVKAWLLLPAGTEEPVPAVVQYLGYGGGRGLAHKYLLWPAAGFAAFVMDTRGQGAGWDGGDTPDPVGSASSFPGFMTKGVEDPEEYYYRRLFTDGVRAVEAARSHPLVDASRTAVVGGSQGGGITLAVAGLVDDLAAAMPDVPFLCDFPRAMTLADQGPYREIGSYLNTYRGRTHRVRKTLAYFDGVHFAARGRAPALFSTALEDQTCPPSTVFAAFNAYGDNLHGKPAQADKTIEVYDFNGHEGGGLYQEAVQLRWLPGRLAA